MGTHMEKSKSRPLRSVWAILAGFLFVLITHLGTDAVMHATGIFPPMFQPMANTLWMLALGYRIAFSIGGSYITARLAPSRPMAHALFGGGIGTLLSLAGLIATWNAGPELGPRWYPLALTLTALPVAWIGGKLYTRKTATGAAV